MRRVAVVESQNGRRGWVGIDGVDLLFVPAVVPDRPGAGTLVYMERVPATAGPAEIVACVRRWCAQGRLEIVELDAEFQADGSGGP